MTSKHATLNRVDVRPALCGYRRLSVDRNGKKIGYEVQTARCESWANDHGYVIERWYEDRDLTAADLKVARPGYEQMLKDVAAGRYAGVIVSRLDRLVRLTREFERALGTIDDADAFLVAAEQGMRSDDSTGFGSMFMRLMVIMAQFEIDTMKTRIRANLAARQAAGKYTGGMRPFGFVGPVYDCGPETKCCGPSVPADERPARHDNPPINRGRIGVEHVPAEVKLIRDAARRVSDGVEWATIAREWNQQGVATPMGRTWSVGTVADTLTSFRMIGRLEYTVKDEDTGEKMKVDVPATWAPVLDRDVWESIRLLVKRGPKRGPKATYLLSGWVLCGDCQMPMGGHLRSVCSRGDKSKKARNYRCPTTQDYRGRGHCGKLQIRAEEVDGLVVGSALRNLAETRGVTSTVGGQEEVRNRQRIAEAVKTLGQCEAKLIELSGMYGTWSLAEISAARLPWEEKQRDAQRVVDTVKGRLRTVRPTTDDEWNDLPRWFKGLSVEQQRQVVMDNVESVTIKRAKRSSRFFDDSRVVIVPKKAVLPTDGQ